MRLTTKGRYALRAMLRLARSGEGRPMSLQRISETEDISVEYLNQLFFKLRKGGLVRSTRGPRGGFSLNRDPANITAQDVLDAVGEGIGLQTMTADVSESSQSSDARDIADSMWAGAAESVKSYFGAITLKKILDRAREGKPDPIV